MENCEIGLPVVRDPRCPNRKMNLFFAFVVYDDSGHNQTHASVAGDHGF